MNDLEKIKKSEPLKGSVLKSLLLIIPMLLLSFLMLSGGQIPSAPSKIFALIMAFIFFNTLFFLMVHTGKTDKFRAIAFCLFALCLTCSFISHYIEARGSMGISDRTLLACKLPFCHIVIPMTLIPMAFTRTIIFPGMIIGGYASIATMFVIWIGVSLALGRGFCSWGCFFGGWDDFFSRLTKKPLIKKISDKLHYLPYAVLLLIVISSAAYLFPTYCAWLCPFKTVTEFQDVTSLKTLLETVIFISLFAGLVVILPFLTKRRTQCGLFCPMGALQSFTNKISPFSVNINKDLCVNCKRCIKVCPTFSMDEKSVSKGKTRITCVKCGKCVDACPEKAIFFHIKGTALKGNYKIGRLLFIYPAFLFLVAFSGSDFQVVIVRLINFVSTGSFLLK